MLETIWIHVKMPPFVTTLRTLPHLLPGGDEAAEETSFILLLVSTHLLPSLQGVRWNLHCDLSCDMFWYRFLHVSSQHSETERGNVHPNIWEIQIYVPTTSFCVLYITHYGTWISSVVNSYTHPSWQVAFSSLGMQNWPWNGTSNGYDNLTTELSIRLALPAPWRFELIPWIAEWKDSFTYALYFSKSWSKFRDMFSIFFSAVLYFESSFRIIFHPSPRKISQISVHHAYSKC